MSGPLVLLDADVVGRERTGDETYVVNLLRELPGVAGDLEFACSLRDPRMLPLDVPAAVSRLRLDVASPYRRIPVAFPRLARRAGAALVHVQYFVAPRLPCPAVVTVHDVSFARAPELFSRRDRMLLGGFVGGSVARARRVIAVSEFTRQDICGRYGVDPERVVAIPNGVSGRFHPVPGARELVGERFGLDERYLLTVGALQARKNVPTLIDAYAQLADGEAPPLLVVVGGDRGGLADVRARIAAHGLEARVRLLGHVPEEALPTLYAAAEALCFPSLYEGFGLPALEAMACGTPVVASRTTGLGEAVGDAALTVDPRSAHAIATALERVLADADLRVSLTAAGLERASRYTWRRTAELTAAVYREALA